MDRLLAASASMATFGTTLAIVVFAAVFLLVAGIAGLLPGRDAVTRRMAQCQRKPIDERSVSLRLEERSIGLLRFLEPIEGKLLPSSRQELSALSRRLQRAGYRHPKAPMIYFGTRLVLAMALLPAALLGLPLAGLRLPSDTLLLAALALSGISFYLPVLWVSRRAILRQRRAREGLPDAIDMLLVCVEAGLSLGAGLERVGREIGRAHPILGEELADVSLAIQAGKGREEALRDLAERLAIDEVASLVGMLVQTEALGTSLAQGLRVHAEDIRRKRFLRAEERANKLPVQMTLPLGLFILPTLMIVVLTPVIVRFVRILFPTMGAS
jgi:tight adherence protein C